MSPVLTSVDLQESLLSTSATLLPISLQGYVECIASYQGVDALLWKLSIFYTLLFNTDFTPCYQGWAGCQTLHLVIKGGQNIRPYTLLSGVGKADFIPCYQGWAGYQTLHLVIRAGQVVKTLHLGIRGGQDIRLYTLVSGVGRISNLIPWYQG